MPVINGRAFLVAYPQLPLAQRWGSGAAVRSTSLHVHGQVLTPHLPIDDDLTKPLTRAKPNDLLARHFPARAARNGQLLPAKTAA